MGLCKPANLSEFKSFLLFVPVPSLASYEKRGSRWERASTLKDVWERG